MLDMVIFALARQLGIIFLTFALLLFGTGVLFGWMIGVLL